MVRVIPEWLQDAVDFLNQKFPDDKDVKLTVLYGYSKVDAGEYDGFALYNTVSKSIYLADFNEIKESYDLNLQEAMETTLMNLFHEYRHHQQNIYGLDLDEDDAEKFAKQITFEFMTCR